MDRGYNDTNIGLHKTYRVMKSIIVAIGFFVGILLTGCSTTTHMFEFYGETHESDGRDFYYVEYSVSGSATAGYTWIGGGNVRDGLIADAKRNLIKSHPLGPNQSYVNMSIDISTTNYTAFFFFNGRVELTATVSADVIQFGQPPKDYSIPVVLEVPSIGSGIISPQPKTQMSTQLIEVAGEDGVIKVGDLVAFTVRLGEEATGEVMGIIQTPNGNIANVKFVFEGEERTSTLPALSLRLAD